MKKKKLKIPDRLKPDIYYYLETSAQIKRLFGHSAHKKIISELLKGKKIYSSFFVFREFKQTIILPLVDFYFVLSEEKNFHDAVSVYLDKTRSIRDTKGFGQHVTAMLLENKTRNDLNNDKNKALIEIKKTILSLYFTFESIINNNFVANISSFNNSKIKLGITDQDFNNFKEQIVCNKHCGQEKFWSKQKDILQVLINQENIDKFKSNKGYFKVVAILKEIYSDFSRADMITRCNALGDAIIAIECPKNFRLISLDKAFIAFCIILQKKYLIIPSIQALKKDSKIIKN